MEKVLISEKIVSFRRYPGRLVERSREERGAMRERAFACERAF